MTAVSMSSLLLCELFIFLDPPHRQPNDGRTIITEVSEKGN